MDKYDSFNLGGSTKDLSSEAWEELGYIQDKPEKALFRIPYSPIRNHQHESLEITQARKQHCLDLIRSVIPEIETKGCVVVGKVKGKVFEFYPSSNTWYSAAKNQFGYDIERLCVLIRKYLVS